MAGNAAPSLLVLHGAGQSCRARFREMREHLVAHGIGSVAFDCIGHGDTGGDLKFSSLQSRTEQARAVVEAVGLPQPFSILAGSMSGYTAVTLLRHYTVAALLLVGPAMYTADAFPVRFNAGFTDIIRRPGSWEASDAWALLARFRGRLLIVAGEHDAVIPPAVIRSIYESAASAAERTLYVAPGVSHMILTDLRAKDPARVDEVLELMTRMLIDNAGAGRGAVASARDDLGGRIEA